MRLEGSRAEESEARPRPGRRKEEKAKVRSADAAGEGESSRAKTVWAAVFSLAKPAPPAAEMKRCRVAIIL